ncbi:MAG: hypothetical protein FWF12_11930, partial [Betaproteobacteria bacterium]|nr:hypothetical protein [Betaproteobacteria bacterium]
MKQALDEVTQRAKALREQIHEIEKAGVTDNNREEYVRLQRELTNVEKQGAQTRLELEKMDKIKLDNLKKQFKDVSDRLTNIGKKLSIGVTAPLVALGGLSFKAASDMVENVNKVNDVFHEAANTVHEFSNTTLLTYGVAKTTTLDLASYFGDMAISMGYSRKEAADMSTALVALAADLGSFKNISMEQTQTALSAIFTGNATAMKSLGVVMTEANLQQYALQQGIKTSLKDMDQMQKVALRMQYVFD